MSNNVAFSQTGYTRPIEAEDVWRVVDSKMSNTVSQQLEKNFYARCPPSRRPLHLGGIRKEDPVADKAMEKKDYENNSACALHQHEVNSVTTQDNHSSQWTSGHSPVTASNQSTLMRTASLVENMSRTFSNTGKQPQGQSEESTHSRLLKIKTFLLGVLLVLHRLNPWCNFQKSRKLEKENVVVEEDEDGIKRTYDSSLFRALVKTIWRRLLFAMCLAACHSVVNTTSSLVTKRLIAFISTSHAWLNGNDDERVSLKSPQSVGAGIGLAFGLALLQEAGSLFQNHYLSQAVICGERYVCIKL